MDDLNDGDQIRSTDMQDFIAVFLVIMDPLQR